LDTGDPAALVGLLKAGLSFGMLVRFQKKAQLPMSVVAKVLHLPPRTLARRKAGGTLTCRESERLVRLADLFDKAVALFEGDAAAATAWLQSANKGLGNQVPLDFAETEIGARAVEDLIGRLEFGVYS
jgi:putative toxin-antitoxin system antitoxin component (TIGR02293 family)